MALPGAVPAVCAFCRHDSILSALYPGQRFSTVEIAAWCDCAPGTINFFPVSRKPPILSRACLWREELASTPLLHSCEKLGQLPRLMGQKPV